MVAQGASICVEEEQVRVGIIVTSAEPESRGCWPARARDERGKNVRQLDEKKNLPRGSCQRMTGRNMSKQRRKILRLMSHRKSRSRLSLRTSTMAWTSQIVWSWSRDRPEEAISDMDRRPRKITPSLRLVRHRAATPGGLCSPETQRRGDHKSST